MASNCYLSFTLSLMTRYKCVESAPMLHLNSDKTYKRTKRQGDIYKALADILLP